MTRLLGTFGTSDRVAANLRSLARHLEEIAAGCRPTRRDLAEAPLIDLWEPKLTANHAPAIRGRVYGHALLADGENIRCDILAADPDLGWIMTFAGFYRLGEALPPPTHPEARA
jgi:hypothetical protein